MFGSSLSTISILKNILITTWPTPFNITLIQQDCLKYLPNSTTLLNILPKHSSLPLKAPKGS